MDMLKKLALDIQRAENWRYRSYGGRTIRDIMPRFRTDFPLEVEEWMRRYEGGGYTIEALGREIERHAATGKTIKSDWETFHPPGCYCCESK